MGLFRFGKFLEDFLQKMQYLWVNRKVYRIMPSKCIFSWEFCYNSRQEGDRPSRLRPQRPPSESLVSHFSKARFTLILFRGGGGFKKKEGLIDQSRRVMFKSHLFCHVSQCIKSIQILRYYIVPECIYNPITAIGFSAMFTFQLDNTKR